MFVLVAKRAQDPKAALDVASLEFLLKCMGSIGREQSITRAHLQRALLDIDRHGLIGHLGPPWCEKLPVPYASHNVSPLTRGSISRHIYTTPTLPGRLPSGKPTDLMSPQMGCFDQSTPVSKSFWPLGVDKSTNTDGIGKGDGHGRGSTSPKEKRQHAGSSSPLTVLAEAAVSTIVSIREASDFADPSAYDLMRCPEASEFPVPARHVKMPPQTRSLAMPSPSSHRSSMNFATTATTGMCSSSSAGTMHGGNGGNDTLGDRSSSPISMADVVSSWTYASAPVLSGGLDATGHAADGMMLLSDMHLDADLSGQWGVASAEGLSLCSQAGKFDNSTMRLDPWTLLVENEEGEDGMGQLAGSWAGCEKYSYWSQSLEGIS